MALETNLIVELAHDLRSPLTSIMSLAEHLQRAGAGPVTDSQRRQLAIIYSAALCLSQTAGAIVYLGRGDRNLDYDRPGPFSLTDLFGESRPPGADGNSAVWIADVGASRTAVGRSVPYCAGQSRDQRLKFAEEGRWSWQNPVDRRCRTVVRIPGRV
jgi:hypothetical protein